jgi:hypothetical protein
VHSAAGRRGDRCPIHWARPLTWGRPSCNRYFFIQIEETHRIGTGTVPIKLVPHFLDPDFIEIPDYKLLLNAVPKHKSRHRPVLQIRDSMPS